MRCILGLSSLAIGICVSFPVGATDQTNTTRKPAWTVAWDAPWVSRRLEREGWIPLVQEGKHYYCWIGSSPRVGSHMNPNYVCGLADDVEFLHGAWNHPMSPDP
jgi:hypothetical protein